MDGGQRNKYVEVLFGSDINGKDQNIRGTNMRGFGVKDRDEMVWTGCEERE